VVEAARRQRTVIMVAHRRATLAGVDAVLVIDEGRVVMLSADVQAALDAATLVKTEVA
jgi:ABC-type transport system involved in cytochrome bd biosynthesis fused ATPase/permease subunit